MVKCLNINVKDFKKANYFQCKPLVNIDGTLNDFLIGEIYAKETNIHYLIFFGL